MTQPTNTELKDFYNNYFKSDDMPAFEELDAEQLRTLKKSSLFASYKGGKALEELKSALREDATKRVNKIATAYKRLRNWAQYV
jgi:hypothetical protein